jgi:hypothetical protein
VSRDWFRERILDLESELREHPTPAPVAFAERGVRWRDGDGPYELRAYKGAALLALGMDATLRARGEPGVASLVADLIALGGRASLETLERWAREHGLEDFWGARPRTVRRSPPSGASSSSPLRAGPSPAARAGCRRAASPSRSPPTATTRRSPSRARRSSRRSSSGRRGSTPCSSPRGTT